jgi:hypothetical protein
MSLSFNQSRERLKIQSRFNDSLNEMFFARCVILVEGPVDEIACRCALEAEGVELDRESVSVMPLGGKMSFRLWRNFYQGFQKRFPRSPANTKGEMISGGSLGVAPAIADFDSVSWSDQPDDDLLAVLMPSARQAEKFDAYYGAAGWDTYASWDRDSYDWSRTR